VKKPNSIDCKFEFDCQSEECYFKGKILKGAFEYNPGKIIVLTEGVKNIRFLDRIFEREDDSLKI
jgi:hypothetical protein